MLELLQRAIAHHLAGRLGAAEDLYLQVLAGEHEQPHALYLLGALRLRAGAAGEAIGLLRRSVARRPEHVDSRLTLANALGGDGQIAEAIGAYRGLLAEHPQHVAARVNLARVLRGQGDLAEAVAVCRQGVDVAPDSPALLEALGSALLAAGDARGAGAAAARALTIDASRIESWFVHGTALSRLGQKLRAVASLTRAVELDPGHAQAALNLGNACLDLDRAGEAERWIREAIVRDPGLVEAHASLGFVLTGLGRLDEAVAACEAAITLQPEFAPAHWNQACAYLLAGDFARGWPKYEWRKKHDSYGAAFRPVDERAWTGQDIAGKRLLVLAEQGMGDTIQFSRFIPMLAAAGAEVILACDARLHELMRTLPGVAGVVEKGGVDKGGVLPAHDLWVDEMSLPLRLGITAERIPGAAGYLTADPAEVAAWRSTLEPGVIGLVWAGNPAQANDGRRSMPFAALAPLLRASSAEATRFVSLQAGPRAADAEGSIVRDLSAHLTCYARTAAIIRALDLVISVDTSVCHLAGALGVPCWVALAYAPDWRWMLGCETTPWYRHMRLFRQPCAGDWHAPMSEIVRALAARDMARQGDYAGAMAAISA